MTRVDFGELMDRDIVRELVHPGPTEFLRPRHAQESELTHLADVFPGKGRGSVQLAGHRGHVLPAEIADHVADLLMLLGEVKRGIHGSNYGSGTATRLAPSGLLSECRGIR